MSKFLGSCCWTNKSCSFFIKNFKTRNPCICAQSLSRGPTLCDPMDCSLPGFSVRGIFQARILEASCHFLAQGIFLTWGVNPCLLACPALGSRFFTTEPPGKPPYIYINCQLKKKKGVSIKLLLISVVR